MRALTLLLVMLGACAAPVEPLRPQPQALKSPTRGARRPWLVTVNSSCVGTLISPTCVLTAKHCINPQGQTDRIFFPYLDARIQETSHGAWMGDSDIGLIYLETAVRLPRYPTAVRGDEPETIDGVTVYGLTIGGRYEAGILWARDDMRVRTWNPGILSTEHFYYTDAITEPGDSGAPWIQGTIRGVHSSTISKIYGSWSVSTRVSRPEHFDWIQTNCPSWDPSAPFDASAVACGDGACSPGEDVALCATDCAPSCVL